MDRCLADWVTLIFLIELDKPDQRFDLDVAEFEHVRVSSNGDILRARTAMRPVYDDTKANL